MRRGLEAEMIWRSKEEAEKGGRGEKRWWEGA